MSNKRIEVKKLFLLAVLLLAPAIFITSCGSLKPDTPYDTCAESAIASRASFFYKGRMFRNINCGIGYTLLSDGSEHSICADPFCQHSDKSCPAWCGDGSSCQIFVNEVDGEFCVWFTVVDVKYDPPPIERKFGIYLYNMSTGKLTEMVSGIDEVIGNFIVLDGHIYYGTSLLHSTGDGSSFANGASRIWSVPKDGGEPVLIYEGLDSETWDGEHDSFELLSSGGGYLYFTNMKAVTAEKAVFRAIPDFSEITQLTEFGTMIFPKVCDGSVYFLREVENVPVTYTREGGNVTFNLTYPVYDIVSASLKTGQTKVIIENVDSMLNTSGVCVENGKIYYCVFSPKYMRTYDYKSYGMTGAADDDTSALRTFDLVVSNDGSVYEYDIATGNTRTALTDSGYNIYNIYGVSDGKILLHGFITDDSRLADIIASLNDPNMSLGNSDYCEYVCRDLEG